LLNGHSDKNKQGSPNRIISAALKGDATGDDDMRDSRNDLQEAAAVHFERMVEQLRNEHDARVADSKVRAFYEETSELLDDLSHRADGEDALVVFAAAANLMLRALCMASYSLEQARGRLDTSCSDYHAGLEGIWRWTDSVRRDQ